MKRNPTLDFQKQTHYPKLILSRFIKYSVILACFLAITMPLIIQSYRLAKEKTIRQTSAALTEGMRTFVQNLDKSQHIKNSLLNDKAFMDLLLLEGELPSKHFLNLNSVQESLFMWRLSSDLISEIYIVFKNNPVFISSKVSSNNVVTAYGDLFYYKDIKYEQWVGKLYEQKYTSQFLPQQEMFYQYSSPKSFNSLTYLVNASYLPSVDNSCVIGCVFDSEQIAKAFLTDELKEDAFFYLQQEDGTLLLSYQYALEKPLSFLPESKTVEVEGKSYMVLQQTDFLTGLQCVVGIPIATYQEGITSLISIVLIYFFAGFCLIAVLSVLFTVRETNENAQYQRQIKKLNNSIQIGTLENLFMVGVHTSKDEETILRNSQCSFERFCIIKFVIQPVSSTCILSVENYLKQILRYPHLLFHMRHDELDVLLLLEKYPNITEEIIKNELEELVNCMAQDVVFHIGVSKICSSVHKVRPAYLQASKAAYMGDYNVSGVDVYENIRKQTTKKIFDFTILLKLSEVIRMGDEEAVQQLFDTVGNKFLRDSTEEQDAIQLFSCVRQVICNEYIDLCALPDYTDASLDITIPCYTPAEKAAPQIENLKDTAMLLCVAVNCRKKSNNVKRKEQIITYLENNFANCNLNACVVAKELSLSEKYVFAFVKASTGKPLGKYIEDLRLEKAEQLLLQTTLPNRKISEAAGFGSENTFYRIFAKKHGVPPSQWREMNQ